MTSRARQIILLCAALAIVALVMLPGLTGGFIFDDYSIIVDNPVVHVTGWHWQAWHDLLAWASGNIQRPLAMLSYAANYAFNASAWGFKATNLLIHILNTWLVALFARQLLAAAWSPSVAQRADDAATQINLWALFTALAWAIHPLQVSTVLYVVQRMELLGLTFVLLSLMAYWRGRQYQLSGHRGWPWLLTTLLLIVAGYTAKETVVLVPGYALLLELTLLHFGAQSQRVSRYWKTSYGLGILVVLILFFTYALPHFAPDGLFPGRPFDALQRELTQLRALSMYLGWIVLPQIGQMHFYYDNYIVSTGLLSPSSTLFSALFLLALAALAIALRKRRPLFCLGIGWFFVAHVLTSAPMPLELVFEHRNYPALLGIVLAITDLVWAATRRAHPRMPLILATIAIVSLGFLCVLRAATWGNPLQLELTLVHDNPSSPRASLDLARRYMTMANGDSASPFFGRSINELERGAALPGSSPLAEQALILTAAMYDFEAPQAWWDHFVSKITLRPLGPQEYLALKGLTQGLINDGDKIDARQLASAYKAITTREPTNVPLHVQYADVASVALNNRPLAIEQLHLALQYNPRSDYAHQLVSYLLEHQRSEEARAVIAQAEALLPDLAKDPSWAKLRVASQAGAAKEPIPATG